MAGDDPKTFHPAHPRDAWPGEYTGDAQSRFVNERNHANIQKHGTYSVVPRMWGGLTTSDELRAIADVADKFKVREVNRRALHDRFLFSQTYAQVDPWAKEASNAAFKTLEPVE